MIALTKYWNQDRFGVPLWTHIGMKNSSKESIWKKEHTCISPQPYFKYPNRQVRKIAKQTFFTSLAGAPWLANFTPTALPGKLPKFIKDEKN